MNDHKQLTINLREELEAARKQLKDDQKGAIVALDSIYRRGIVPGTLLNGRYWGEFITSNFNPFLDTWLDNITKVWLPWEGKVFDAETGSGSNIFTNDILFLGHLIWPFYNGYVPDNRGRSLAFKFQASFGKCLLEPDIEVLRLNFDLPENPQFLIYELVDQLVQIGDDFYLGKAVLKHPEGGRFCAAYFTLRLA